MSRQKTGMFRKMTAAIMGLVGMPVMHHYPDPVLGSPESRRKKTVRWHRKDDLRPMMRRGNLGPPPCEPGTVTYHDKLVAHFGRRLAEGYRIAIQRGHLNLLPSEQDFADNPPWAWRRA